MRKQWQANSKRESSGNHCASFICLAMLAVALTIGMRLWYIHASNTSVDALRSTVADEWCHKRWHRSNLYENAKWENWRALVPIVMKAVEAQNILVPTTASLVRNSRDASHVSLQTRRDIFEFGVYNGKSMKELHQYLPDVKIWGFDSFAGLPSDTASQQAVWASAWGDSWKNVFAPGKYHAKANVVEELTSALGGSSHVEFIKGFYNVSLTSTLKKERGIFPARYIDIDADLYISTYEALDWVFMNGLATVGTVIGYDDFWVPPCVVTRDPKLTPVHPLEAGEGQAHRLIAEKYGVQFVCVAGSCAYPKLAHPYSSKASDGCDIFNSWSPLFMVAGFGTHSTGFEMNDAQVKSFLSSNPDCDGSRWNSLVSQSGIHTSLTSMQQEAGVHHSP